jgi:uncharacterized protein YdeI (YjbR/CyaY-like superfamily)
LFREWLLQHHRQLESVWLVTFKKQVPGKYVSRESVLDELLCFGWIDGIRRKYDDDKTMQLISPRKAQHWSNTYKERYARLLKEKKVAPSGKASVANSKRLGLWDFMDDVDSLAIPTDFMEALKKHPSAYENFNRFGAASQRFCLRWIKLSKTESTRKKRIALAAELASQRKKIPGA